MPFTQRHHAIKTHCQATKFSLLIVHNCCSQLLFSRRQTHLKLCDTGLDYFEMYRITRSGHSASRGPNTLLPFCDAAFMTAQHVRPQTPSNFLPCHGPVLTAARKLGRPHRGRPDRVRRLLPGRSLPRVGARDAGHVGQERRVRLRSPGQPPVRRPRPRPRSSWQVFLSELPVRTSGRGQTW